VWEGRSTPEVIGGRRRRRWNLVVMGLLLLPGCLVSLPSGEAGGVLSARAPELISRFSAGGARAELLSPSVARGRGGFVQYVDEGNLICRRATREERLSMRRRTLMLPLRVISPVHLTQQPDGLNIMLRGTSQLESFPEAQAAFLRAAARWEALIHTPITIVIDVDFGPTRFGEPFDEGVLGSTIGQPLLLRSGYPDIRSRLIEGASNAQEASLYPLLPIGAVPTDLGDTADVFAPSAVFRALGLIDPVADPDGERGRFGDPPNIGFNANFQFDFNPADGIDREAFDFETVAAHEIGHVLGFISNVGEQELSPSARLSLTTWDLFRFRPDTTRGTFPAAQRILSSGGDQVFFAGGPELPLSTGRPDGSGGDGRQASHWKDDDLTGQYIGIMDPTIPPGVRQEITDNDLLALNFMGHRIEAPAVQRGDVNQDGVVNVQDVIRLIQHLTGERPLTGAGLEAADVNRDGVVNVQDVILLIQMLTGQQSTRFTIVARRALARGIALGEGEQTRTGMSVPIVIDDGSGIAAAQVVIAYDPVNLQLAGPPVVTRGELVPGDVELHVNAGEPGRIVVVLAPPVRSPVPMLRRGPGTLLWMHFRPVGEAGAASVRLVQAVFADGAGHHIPALHEH